MILSTGALRRRGVHGHAWPPVRWQADRRWPGVPVREPQTGSAPGGGRGWKPNQLTLAGPRWAGCWRPGADGAVAPPGLAGAVAALERQRPFRIGTDHTPWRRRCSATSRLASGITSVFSRGSVEVNLRLPFRVNHLSCQSASALCAVPDVRIKRPCGGARRLGAADGGRSMTATWAGVEPAVSGRPGRGPPKRPGLGRRPDWAQMLLKESARAAIRKGT